MQASIIQIGNSRGLRLPKAVLNRYHITDKVEMILEEGQIILKPIQIKPREGWEAAFSAMHREGDDVPLFPDVFDDEQEESWL